MSLQRLQTTRIKSPGAERLQHYLIAYHQFRNNLPADERFTHLLADLCEWQSFRLISTHRDIYDSPDHTTAFRFLLEDLYSAKDFGQRDEDMERVFPAMVRLLPEYGLVTLARVIELNLLTQQLDLAMVRAIQALPGSDDINATTYAAAYRGCANRTERHHQIKLMATVGADIDRYVHSALVNFSLKITRKPAEMAGLAVLHDFMQRGVTAFRQMGKSVQPMLNLVTSRELIIMDQINAGMAEPFNLPPECP